DLHPHRTTRINPVTIAALSVGRGLLPLRQIRAHHAIHPRPELLITLPANPDRTSRRTAEPPTHTIDSAVTPPASSNAINRCPVHQILVTTGPQHARPPQGPSATSAASRADHRRR